jgi:hypothetical protein
MASQLSCTRPPTPSLSNRKPSHTIRLPSELRGYVKYIVAVDRSDGLVYSFGVKYIRDTQGAWEIFRFLIKNAARKHKRHVHSWLCPLVRAGLPCPREERCPNLHVTPEGNANRRLWLLNEARSPLLSALDHRPGSDTDEGSVGAVEDFDSVRSESGGEPWPVLRVAASPPPPPSSHHDGGPHKAPRSAGGVPHPRAGIPPAALPPTVPRLAPPVSLPSHSPYAWPPSGPSAPKLALPLWELEQQQRRLQHTRERLGAAVTWILAHSADMKPRPGPSTAPSHAVW